MTTATAYSFLIHNGLWSDTVFAVTGSLVGGLLAKAWASFHHFHPQKLWEEHVHAQKQIADALDTSTPGGLTDLAVAVDELNKEKKS